MLPNEAMYPYTAKEARDRGELEVWLRLKNMHIEELKIYSDMLDVEFPAKLEKLCVTDMTDQREHFCFGSGKSSGRCGLYMLRFMYKRHM